MLNKFLSSEFLSSEYGQFTLIIVCILVSYFNEELLQLALLLRVILMFDLHYSMSMLMH